ncbi:MAG TPA: TIGR04283 family arsenosugar biosynthesis glycosyltransferase [Flavisolibacter sp.]|nr:TIGR04283 family arsenosugar biosynthesis glycosyltransferase [Flavisolibacter sp.]
MDISIIIPACNEEENIPKLIEYLNNHSDEKVKEVILIDGGSSDNTLHLAAAAGVKAIVSPQKGRAAQMNYGASLATGNIFYFVHADTFPPASFVKDISNAVKQGYDFGRYKSKFLSKKPLLWLNEWFTALDLFICMGGDQTLFIKKDWFKKLNGFRSDMLIMEEYEFCKRARDAGARYKIMKGSALISARKYDKNSWLQVQLANYRIVKMYKKGDSQQSMVDQYKKMLNL